MQLNDFKFDLPDELIARYPIENRSDSRLMLIKGKAVEHKKFTDLLFYLQPGDLLVLNNVKVIPARLFGKKLTGGKIEILLERVAKESSHTAWVHLKANKKPKIGDVLILGNNEKQIKVSLLKREADLFLLSFPQNKTILAHFEALGSIPLPPYINRAAQKIDQKRYQTVFADDSKSGAVAAPTAGLHFDEAMLARIKAKGVEIAYITLFVGAGTFQSVRSNNIEEHRMHKESFVIDDEVVSRIKCCKQNNKKVVAVGTTCVRALEAAALSPQGLSAMNAETDIYIYPGFQFQVVDALLTNFHLPDSTLILLVSAFAGFNEIKHGYQEAIKECYRFYSYGDAMLLHRKKHCAFHEGNRP